MIYVFLVQSIYHLQYTWEEKSTKRASPILSPYEIGILAYLLHAFGHNSQINKARLPRFPVQMEILCYHFR